MSGRKLAGISRAGRPLLMHTPLSSVTKLSRHPAKRTKLSTKLSHENHAARRPFGAAAGAVTGVGAVAIDGSWLR